MLHIFSQRLRECRKQNRISVFELADKLKCSPKTVYSWETGTRECDLENFLKLCSLLNEDPNYLLGWDEYPGNHQDK